MTQLTGWMACLMLAAVSGSCSHPGNRPADAPAPPDFTVDTPQVITADFIGTGTQYNQNLYAAISKSDGITPANVGDLEAKVKRLGSQHVRIFFDSRALDSLDYPDYMSSFIRTVKLAQASGATVNITYWHGPYTHIADQMSAFADVLYDLIVTRGLVAVKYVTIQNEVNSTAISMDTYRQLYTALAAALQQLGIRNAVALIGGDLVRTSQQAWFAYMADHMSDLLDGYSIHIYWTYTDRGYGETRLSEVRDIVNSLPAGSRKPVFITEYGVRGDRTACPGPGCLTGTTTPIEGTLVNAFQHAWFTLEALNDGYVALVKWDAYKAKYDNGEQYFSEIGSGNDGYPLTPVYQVSRLLAATSRPGWSVVAVTQRTTGALVSALTGSGGDMTVYVLNDTDGNRAVSVGGLPAGRSFHLLSWNADGSGTIRDMGSVQTDKTGMVRVSLHFQEFSVLTTLDPAGMDL